VRRVKHPLENVPYPLVCIGLGLVLGWAPKLIHGPIPEKFDVLYIQGSLAVWAYYTARLLIGVWVGLTTWPARWWLRGPMVGFLSLAPLGWLALSMPGCGFPCMRLNLSTATGVGFAIAGLAYLLTGKHNASQKHRAPLPP